jgi:DNA-binding transcriptional ArsR family regulator
MPLHKENVGEPTCAHLKRLLGEAHMTVEQLAEAVGIDPRSVYRHLAGEVLPQPPKMFAYQRVFSQALNRTVVIRKVSGKCQIRQSKRYGEMGLADDQNDGNDPH